MLPSPKEQRDKFRRETPPKKRLPNPMLPPAQGDHPQNSGGEPRQVPSSFTSDEGDKKSAIKQADISPPRRNLWARFSTGRLGIIGKLSHPELRGPGILTSKAATSAVTGALDEGKIAESLDDFSIPSSTSTKPGTVLPSAIRSPIMISAENGTLTPIEDGALNDEVAAQEFDGLQTPNGVVDSALFSQTRLSSDDLVASMSDTPSPRYLFRNKSPPTTPSPLPPPPKMKELKDSSADASPPHPPESNETNEDWGNSPSPRRIPKYKVALAANILSPSRTVTA